MRESQAAVIWSVWPSTGFERTKYTNKRIELAKPDDQKEEKYCILRKTILHQNPHYEKVADILSHKGKHITSVSPETTVLEALRIMAEQNIGTVLVLHNQQYQGIMTERDYSRKVILKGKSSTDTPVSEIMSRDLPPVSPSDTIEFCMQLLSDKNIRYLPVFDNGVLCGIISISDVVKETILTQQETITHLKDYLHSGG